MTRPPVPYRTDTELANGWLTQREDGYRTSRALGWLILAAVFLLALVIGRIAWQIVGAQAVIVFAIAGLIGVLAVQIWLDWRAGTEDVDLVLECSCGAVCPSPYGPVMAAWEIEHQCDDEVAVA